MMLYANRIKQTKHKISAELPLRFPLHPTSQRKQKAIHAFAAWRVCICLGCIRNRSHDPASDFQRQTAFKLWRILRGERSDLRAPGEGRISERNNLCCHRVGLDLEGHLCAAGWISLTADLRCTLPHTHTRIHILSTPTQAPINRRDAYRGSHQ